MGGTTRDEGAYEITERQTGFVRLRKDGEELVLEYHYSISKTLHRGFNGLHAVPILGSIAWGLANISNQFWDEWREDNRVQSPQIAQELARQKKKDLTSKEEIKKILWDNCENIDEEKFVSMVSKLQDELPELVKKRLETIRAARDLERLEKIKEARREKVRHASKESLLPDDNIDKAAQLRQLDSAHYPEKDKHQTFRMAGP